MNTRACHVTPVKNTHSKANTPGVQRLPYIDLEDTYRNSTIAFGKMLRVGQLQRALLRSDAVHSGWRLGCSRGFAVQKDDPADIHPEIQVCKSQGSRTAYS
jgi:hypothetical protein